jgi:proline iminopeptidase
MKWGLSPFIIGCIADILQKFPDIQSATIFGSRAKGTYKNASDIDIAIHAPHRGATDFARLNFEIQETPIVYKMDVVHFDRLGNQEWADKIMREEQVFYPVRGDS